MVGGGVVVSAAVESSDETPLCERRRASIFHEHRLRAHLSPERRSLPVAASAARPWT